MRSKTLRLTGWGRSSASESTALRPERPRDVDALLRHADPADGPWLAHGAGRSYGDTALNAGGRVILTERLDRVLSFNAETGELVCEGGVPLRDVLACFGPRGFVAPVSPGTSFATVGGSIANDVHGKNHESAGSFGDHVAWLELLTPSGERLHVDEARTPELFRATIGGIGLTGLITKACLRLKRVPSTTVEVSERRIANLDAFLDAFEECRHSATFSVGWIDGVAKGDSLGRGILETAEFAQHDTPAKAKKAKTVPIDVPGFVLNPLTVRAFNHVYYHRIPAQGRSGLKPYGQFLYPLDALLRWNRIYGKRGFLQFQCVLPDQAARAGLHALMTTISEAGLASFLAVLKTLGSEGKGYLSFPLRGYTLALDFPRSAKAIALVERLNAITLDHGGRVYLAKDAVLKPEQFARMYPKLDDMRAVLHDLDRGVRFDSDQARRLAVREAA